MIIVINLRIKNILYFALQRNINLPYWLYIQWQIGNFVIIKIENSNVLIIRNVITYMQII